MISWGLVFLLSRLRKIQSLNDSTLYTILFVIQLPVAFILTLLQAALITIALLYWIIRGHTSPLDRVDIFCLAFLTLACIYSFLGSFLLNIVWAKFEVWSLKPLHLLTALRFRGSFHDIPCPSVVKQAKNTRGAGHSRSVGICPSFCALGYVRWLAGPDRFLRVGKSKRPLVDPVHLSSRLQNLDCQGNLVCLSGDNPTVEHSGTLSRDWL